MEDFVLIVSIAALFALGLIPVIKLDRFVRGRREIAEETEPYPQRKRRSSKGDLLDEFDRSGVLYFDLPCDPGQIDGDDLKQLE